MVTSTPEPPSATAATTSTTLATTTTQPTRAWRVDPDFAVRVGVYSQPLFDAVLAAVVISEAPPYGAPVQASLYRVVPPTGTLIPMLSSEGEPPLGHADGDGGRP